MLLKTYTLKVSAVIRETSDTVTICFKQPGLKKIKYQAGQYLTLIFRINGRKYQRPYSFSSAPEADQTLNVTVKRVKGGVVSNHIADCVKVDDVIEVMEPMGDFIIDPNTIFAGTDLFLWGAGSGVTPLFSLAKHVLKTYPEQKVTLVYGNRGNEEYIFKEQLDALKTAHPAQLDIWHFHTQTVVTDEFPNIIQGRISPEKLFEVIGNKPHSAKSLHYICGPLGLKESIVDYFEKNGFTKATVFSEEFNLVADPEKFKDVITRKITVSVKGDQHEIEVVKGKTILDACLDALIELPYSCQTGTCLVCKAGLTAGKIKYIIGESALADLPENEILICCSVPDSDDLSIETI